MSAEQVRSYTADSMREALVMVRKDLGPDALIVSQENQGRKVLLTAALELPESAALASESAAQAGSLEVPAEDSPSSTFDELLLDEVVTLNPHSEEPSNSLLEALKQIDERSLRFPLEAKTIAQLQGNFRFIGASGVGKTSLLIKILVEWVQHNDPADVRVVVGANDRLGAHEALALTCQILNVELVHSDHSSAWLEDSGSHSARQLVLIDASLNEASPVAQQTGVRDVLVVSALHSVCALQDQLQRLADHSTQLVGITHVDQAFATQEFIRWLFANDLQPAFFTTGAGLLEHLEVATAASFNRFFALTDA